MHSSCATLNIRLLLLLPLSLLCSHFCQSAFSHDQTPHLMEPENPFLLSSTCFVLCPGTATPVDHRKGTRHTAVPAEMLHLQAWWTCDQHLHEHHQLCAQEDSLNHQALPQCHPFNCSKSLQKVTHSSKRALTNFATASGAGWWGRRLMWSTDSLLTFGSVVSSPKRWKYRNLESGTASWLAEQHRRLVGTASLLKQHGGTVAVLVKQHSHLLFSAVHCRIKTAPFADDLLIEQHCRLRCNAVPRSPPRWQLE